MLQNLQQRKNDMKARIHAARVTPQMPMPPLLAANWNNNRRTAKNSMSLSPTRRKLPISLPICTAVTSSKQKQWRTGIIRRTSHGRQPWPSPLRNTIKLSRYTSVHPNNRNTKAPPLSKIQKPATAPCALELRREHLSQEWQAQPKTPC